MTCQSVHDPGKAESVTLSPAAKFVWDSSVFSLSHLLGAVFVLIRSFLVARCLGPYGFGIWQFVNIFERYSSYVSIGTQSAISRQVPFLRGRGDTQSLQQLLNTSFTINLLNPIIYILFVLICSFFVKQALEANILIAYSPVILLSSWIGYNNVLLVSMGLYSFRSRLAVLQDGITMLLCISLVYILDIYGLVLGFLIAGFVIFTVSSYNLWTKLSIKIEWRVLFDLIFTGIPIMANGLLMTTMGIIDRILIAMFLNREILGVYGVASIGINILRTVLSSFGQMLFVKFAEMDGQSKTAGHMLIVLDKTTTILACFFSPIIGVIVSCLPLTVILLLPQFSAGIAAGRLLLAETFFLGISLPSANWCIATGHFMPLLIIRVVSIIIEIASIYFVILYKLNLEFISLCVLSTSIIFSLFISITANHFLGSSFRRGFIRWIRWTVPSINITFVMWIQERYYTIDVDMPRGQLLESCLLGLTVSLLGVTPLAFWAERRTRVLELLYDSLLVFLKRRSCSQSEGKPQSS